MSSIEMPVSKQIKSSTMSTLGNKSKVGCVIMASGLGKRFGGNKLMAELGDKPLIQWILDATKDMFDQRVVVTRSSEVKSLCEDQEIDVILHDMPGRNDTVRLGLTSMADKVDYCFFTPADQPFIKRESIKKLIDKTNQVEQCIVRSAFGERVGAPVGFPKWTFKELLDLSAGEGGSAVVKRHKDQVLSVQVSEEAELDDIDTKEELQNAKIKLYNKQIQ